MDKPRGNGSGRMCGRRLAKPALGDPAAAKVRRIAALEKFVPEFIAVSRAVEANRAGEDGACGGGYRDCPFARALCRFVRSATTVQNDPGSPGEFPRPVETAGRHPGRATFVKRFEPSIQVGEGKRERDVGG